MFSHVKRKICSQHGASLSMALMLFLVCTVVASITLSAATAVAGRVSQLKEADASYYNVSSAARFVWDELKGEDGNGLVVEVTRTCDAQKDESGNWTGWVMKIDSVYDSSSGEVEMNTISPGTATLFQIATYDIIMGNPKPSFSSSRSADVDSIAARFDKDGSVPVPLEAVFDSFSYDGFAFKVGDLAPVLVKVTKNEDQTFDFEFCQADEDNPNVPDGRSYICTLTALVEIGEDKSSLVGAEIKRSTQIRWTPLNITVGELS